MALILSGGMTLTGSLTTEPPYAPGQRGVFSIFGDISYITVDVESNATAFASLSVGRWVGSATSNGNNMRGVFCGGSSTNIIDYISTGSLVDAIDFGDLLTPVGSAAAASNGTNERGVLAGGDNSGAINVIQWITISSLGYSSNFGDLAVSRYDVAGTDNGTNDVAVFAGGGPNYLGSIEWITISSLGNAGDFGNLSWARTRIDGTSNGTNNRAIFGGGYTSTPTRITRIDYVNMTSLGNAGIFGNLVLARQRVSATSNGTEERGVFAGGQAFAGDQDIMEYVTISNTSNTTDFGDLAVITTAPGALSDA